MNPRAVLLAAGASRRLGEPKALATLSLDPGDSPLARLAASVHAALGEAPLVVTGAHHAAIAAAAENLELPLELLENPAWERGRTGGVTLAAAHLPGRDLLLLPVDVPRVGPDVIRTLVQAWTRAERPPRGWLAPYVVEIPEPAGLEAQAPRRRYGHPILIGRALAAELADFDPDRPLWELRRRAAPLLGEPTAEVSVLEDLDTREDLERIRADEQSD